MAKVAKTSPIVTLFETAKKFCELSNAEIAAESGIPAEDGDQAIRNFLRRQRMVHVPLVNWILHQTVLSGSAIERAMTSLEQAGLNNEQLQSIRTVIESMQPKPLPDSKASKAVQTSAPRVFMEPIKAKEESAPYGAKPVNGKRPPVNLRPLIPVFHATTPDDPKAIPVPKWLHLAAGDGCDLELCEDYKYFRELPDWKGVHSAVVRGESMLETLEPGDVIVMKEFPGGRYTLPKIESKDEKTSLETFKAQFKLKDRDIVIVSINGDSPTLKRIRIAVWKDRPLDWKLQITADNEDAWGPARQIEVGDEIIFHAKLIGLEGRKKAPKTTY